jgi:hypothetical protein
VSVQLPQTRASLRGRLAQRIDAIEAAYEFFLAYAAQGLVAEAVSTSTALPELRRHLDGFVGAATDLAPHLRGHLGEIDGSSAALVAFLDVLDADSRRALAAVEVVRASSSPTSQLVDNLNASHHVRAFLTDLFLIDEALSLTDPPSPTDS